MLSPQKGKRRERNSGRGGDAGRSEYPVSLNTTLIYDEKGKKGGEKKKDVGNRRRITVRGG